jgi:hypothetical protein
MDAQDLKQAAVTMAWFAYSAANAEQKFPRAKCSRGRPV